MPCRGIKGRRWKQTNLVGRTGAQRVRAKRAPMTGSGVIRRGVNFANGGLRLSPNPPYVCGLSRLPCNEAQKAFGNPAWRRIALAVWRLGIPSKIPFGKRTVPNFMAALPLTNQRATSGSQQVTQRLVELRSHSGDGRLGFTQRGDLEE
jgi:hypothetical protein